MRAAVAVALLLASTQANAFAPTKRTLPSGREAGARRRLTSSPSAGHQPSARSAFTRLAQQGWQASWDSMTGVPAWLWGPGVIAFGAVADASRAEAAARAFISANLDVLAPGAAIADLVLVSNQLDGAIRTVAFQQTWRGMRVVDGQLGVVIANDRIFAASSAAWPNVDASSPARANASVQKQRAEKWLHEHTGVRGIARGSSERVVVPSVRATGNVSYAIADVLEVAAPSGERWTIFVSPDGTPLAGREATMPATATLQYNVGIRYGSGARANYPAPDVSLTVNGNASMTDASGMFSWGGTSASSVVPGLESTYIRIINQAGPLATDTLTAQPSSPVVWMRSLTELSDAQISTFIYGGIAKARARIVNPDVASWLDMKLDFYVNENNTCNAYSGGDDVHLSRADGTCENTGRVGDVVYHEFGHALHKHSVIAGMGAFESHLSEGLSDFFAANLTGDPAVGRGFFKSDAPLRQIDPEGYERSYPLDFDFDPHVSGLIIGGALWDLRKALIASLGMSAGITRAEKIFTGLMQRANDISTTFMAALIADDDDGSLGNKTPNYCAIERAFGVHGLVPDYVTTTAAVPVIDGMTIKVGVTTPSGTACPPRQVATIIVTWRADDGVPSELALTSDSQGVWSAAFPELPDGAVISYSVDVRYDDGSIQSYPDNPADPRYQLFVGAGTPIWCESFDVDPEWEQTSNTSLEWEWGPARPDTGTHDPDSAVSAPNVIGTRLTGTGNYRPMIVTSIQTPAIDVSAFEIVRLQYWRWLTIEDALFDQATITANDTEVWRNASAQAGTLDHVDREWRFHDIDLSPHVVDGAVQIEWALTSDFGKELGGWTIDDVCIVGLAKVPRCGDGEVDYGEQCDDGNRRSDDGCTHDCIDEVTAGGGGCCSASGGGKGSFALALLVALGLWGQRRRRSSSFSPLRSVSLRMPSRPADRAGRRRS
jgi:cysteine-rich repeat protein